MAQGSEGSRHRGSSRHAWRLLSDSGLSIALSGARPNLPHRMALHRSPGTEKQVVVLRCVLRRFPCGSHVVATLSGRKGNRGAEEQRRDEWKRMKERLQM